jgi:hypothetical protein
MMLIIALAAVALGANDLWRRRERYLALKDFHEGNVRAQSMMALRHAEVAAQNEREAKRFRAAILADREATKTQKDVSLEIAANIKAAAEAERDAERKCRAEANRHETLRLKYERAARYFWRLVEPDPPGAG